VELDLAMSRAIGDAHLRPYIIPDPDFVSVQLDDSALYLILATDGVFDSFEASDIASIITEIHSMNSGASTDEIAATLVYLALELGSTDIISAQVVDLRGRARCIAAEQQHISNRHGAAPAARS